MAITDVAENILHTDSIPSLKPNKGNWIVWLIELQFI